MNSVLREIHKGPARREIFRKPIGRSLHDECGHNLVTTAILFISPLVIGLTVVAFGTSSLELAVSLKAKLNTRIANRGRYPNPPIVMVYQAVVPLSP